MSTTQGTETMTSRTYAAQANDMAGVARGRAVMPCPVSPDVSFWSPISLGTTHKHGRPRLLEASHP